METSTIVTATEYKAGKRDILVETKHAQSFRSFLTEKGVHCSLLSDAVYQGARVYRDQTGQWQHERQCTVQTFEADCTWKDFGNWTNEWCLAVLYRKPISN